MCGASHLDRVTWVGLSPQCTGPSGRLPARRRPDWPRAAPRVIALATLAGALLAPAASAQSTAKKPAAKSTAPAKSPAPAKPKAAKPAAPKAPGDTETGEPLVASGGSVAVHDTPNGASIATLGSGAFVTAIARDRGWVRVRVDGWVKDDSLAPARGATRALSAADLRTDPQGAKGKTVRWDVQILAMQTADPLHHDLSPDEPYLLARGPGPESALLYVAIPPSLLASARAIAAGAPTTVALIATVRVGKSEPVGVPVLDAQSLVRR